MKKHRDNSAFIQFFVIFIILVLLVPFVIKRQSLGIIHLLWIIGFFILFRCIYSPGAKRYDPPNRIGKSTRLIIGIIILLAVALRIYKIESIPPGLWVDEMYTASNAVELTTGGFWKNPFLTTPLVGEGWVETSNLYLYFVRFLWIFFGMNYIGVKMVSILPGVCAVYFLYVFVRRLWGIRAGLCAAFFLAVSSWQISLSRWGWDEVFLTCFQIPVYLFLWRGLRKGRIYDFALSGLFLGLCLYTYAASRIIVLFIVCFLLLEILFTPRFLQKNKRGLPIFFLFAFLTFLPLGFYYLKHPSVFNARFRDVSVFNEISREKSLDPLIKNIFRHVFMFHFYSDPNIRHHLSGKPLLDIISGLAMIPGFLLLLIGIRKSKNRFFLLWMIFGLLGGILSLSREAPQSYRTGISAPAVFAQCGIGLVWLERIARRMMEKRNVVLMRTMTVAVLLGCLALNIHRYFILYPKEPDLWKDFWGADRSFMARVLKSRNEEGANILLDTSYKSNFYFVFRVAVRIICQKRFEYFDPVRRTPGPKEQGMEIFLPPFRKEMYEYLLPSVTMKPIMNPIGEAAFYQAWIDPRILAQCPDIPAERTSPFEMIYYRNLDLLKREYKETPDIFPVPQEATRIAINTILLLPQEYHTLFLVESSCPTEVFLDGSRVELDKKGGIFIPLSKDPHPMTIEIKDVKPSVRFQLLWRPDFEHTEPIPPEFFLPKDLGAKTDSKTP